VAERTGDHEQAQFLYLQASAEIETQRVSFLHNDLRLTLFNGKQEVYAALVTRSLGEDDDESAAFTWCERAKARQLIDMVEHHLPIIRPHTDHSLLTRINHLRHELNSRYFQLGTGTDELPLLGSSDAINAKQIELNSCLQQMADIDPQYVALQTDSVVDLSELQSNLSSDTTLIEYFVAGDEVLAFVITARAYHVHRYLCPMSRVDYLTERYYGAFRNHAQKQRGSSSRDATLQASADQFLHQLYVTLVAPLEDDIEGVKLLLVPHGLMHYLPFHAFYDGNSYLTDRFDIAYAPSSSVLHQCNVQKSAPSLLRVPGVLEPQSAFAFNSARSEEGIRVRIAATGEEPKEEFLQSISAADRIHISSDCLLRYDSPLFSGFKLRGGWITALDLFSISCHSDLVTLSGSMSAINRDGRGEDIVAIQRGWLYAGAQTILMRLWNTDDRMTEAILSAFHVRWDGRETTKCSALRRAMRDVREEHPNPYRWAPFIICGRG
jgi:CHAT domain-containing protein